jgi:hypothetical protein
MLEENKPISIKAKRDDIVESGLRIVVDINNKRSHPDKEPMYDSTIIIQQHIATYKNLPSILNLKEELPWVRH